MTTYYTISIDAGIDGAISLFRNGVLYSIVDVSENLEILNGTFEILRSIITDFSNCEITCIIEQLPKLKSARSYVENFKLYEIASALKTLCVVYFNQTPFEIPSNKWKAIIPKSFYDEEIKDTYKRGKEASRTYAIKTYIDKYSKLVEEKKMMPVNELFGLKKHHNRSDSFLLGIYFNEMNKLKKDFIIAD
jgi:hypothetical protein